MKFSAREEIDVPIEAAFEMVSDFAVVEQAAIRRGAEVQRTDTRPATVSERGVGMAWDAAIDFQGKRRRLAVELAEFDPPTRLAAEVRSEGLVGVFHVGFLALTPRRTRVTVQFDLAARTLTARVLLQSLKLAKARLDAHFEQRVDSYLRDMEARHRGRA